MNETGHNSGALTPEEHRALFFNHFNKIERQARIAKAAREQLGRLRKAAKADGIKLKEMDFALRCDAMEDGNIIIDEFKGMARVLFWMGLPVNFQSEMFGHVESHDERTYAAGALASATKRPCKSPHAPGSEPDQAWIRGFNEDGAASAKALEVAMKKSAALAAKAKSGPGKSEAEKALDGEPGFEDDQPLAKPPKKAAE